MGNVVWRHRPALHSCNGCFRLGCVTSNLLASASGSSKENISRWIEFYIYHCFGRFSPSDPNIMNSVSTQLILVLTSLLLILPVVEAVEAGDAIALLLGVVLSITGICACLGIYARKRNGQI
ncbi:small integral membrane protein 30 [Grammomys surdaster]|uniref:small integral membrane protein 30 n=2 Tax=Murinae TaxID=39107 RepID=UPI0010A00F66|nr:small integral membrane protein 30 [Grammomys surdaster]